ncbi:MAG TPA: ribbon-helix-helix protein, CopG family [Candidatus Bathyarchaeia archaeon]
MSPRPSRGDDIKAFQVRLSFSLIKQVKHQAIEEGISFSVLVERALLQYFVEGRASSRQTQSEKQNSQPL